jgi:hypothetical protein
MMKLFDYETVLSYPIETVFQHTVDLEHAPRWHPIFYHIEQTTLGNIGLGTQWRKHYRFFGMQGVLHLQIVDWKPYQTVHFQGSCIAGMIPNFVIHFEPVASGTHIHYILQPTVPRFMQLPMAFVGPFVGRRDLRRYFSELDRQIAQAVKSPSMALS